ncbi:hypothetical protein AB6F62_13240 [Providencia huaxiensis]|uniref:hypothetical protein n=1 Tax=Providencia huaxiensis TaxID=2027290 RepID=UPI0034DCCD36
MAAALNRITAIEGEKYRHNYLCRSYKKDFSSYRFRYAVNASKAISGGAFSCDALGAIQRL